MAKVEYESEELPEAFRLRPLGHKPNPKRCEFFIDNVEGREDGTEIFTLQTLTGAVRRIMEKCNQHGLTGQTVLGGGERREGTVYVKIRYPRVQSLVGEGGEGGNTTYVELDGAEELEIGGSSDEEKGLTSRTWMG